MPGAKRQERAAATQSQLLEAARTVFAERGYQATSVAAITDAASTAHGTFYLYFRNKEDVFAQLMATAMDELYAQTLTELDPETHLYDPNVARDRVAGFLQVAVSQGKIWRALLEAILVSPTIAASWLELRAVFHQGLADRLRIYQERGEFRDLDPSLVAQSLAGMLEWHVFTSASFGVPGPLEASPQVIDTIADLWASAIDVGGRKGQPAAD
ncbi:MAG TPA: TetR/AcrR family transcriptional regulator [Acidimicrobiales bacterium]|jgi:AcrR family transcriptional regulator|nr:TetR/AcrR family transcriptional regulator [Acidimicrobiales bacterium]